jgi:hypothetical protein
LPDKSGTTYKGTINPGLHKRLVNLKGLPDAEVEATHLLLAGEGYLPKHIQSQFFQAPNYPATKLVGRLQALADVNPEYAKRAKPLLDNLNAFFPRNEGDQGWGQVSPSGLLLPEEQGLPQRKLKGEQPPQASEEAVLKDLGAQQQLPGSGRSTSKKGRDTSGEAPTQPAAGTSPEEAQSQAQELAPGAGELA